MTNTTRFAGLCAVVVAASACERGPRDDIGPEAIADHPELYAGATVSVVADVEEVINANAFLLDEDSLFRGGIDNDLLVLSDEASSLVDIDDSWLGNQVRVVGEVALLRVEEIEAEVGPYANPQVEAELVVDRPVLVAAHVWRVSPKIDERLGDARR